MKIKIKEVQDHFKNQILSGNFKVTEVTTNIATVLVERKFKFTFWTSNGKEYFKQYYGLYANFMELGTINPTQKIELFEAINKLAAPYLKDVTVKKKELEIKTLNEAIEKIKQS